MDKRQRLEYNKLLKHPLWIEFSKKIRNRDGNKCVVCGSKNKVQAHHRQYRWSKYLKGFIKPWKYPENLLVSLCKKCHDYGHEKYKIAIKKVT